MRYLFSPQQLFLILQINAFLVVLGIRHLVLYMLDKRSHYCISSSKWRVRHKLSPDQSRVECTVHTHTTSEGNRAQRVTLSHSKYSMTVSPQFFWQHWKVNPLPPTKRLPLILGFPASNVRASYRPLCQFVAITFPRTKLQTQDSWIPKVLTRF